MKLTLLESKFSVENGVCKLTEQQCAFAVLQCARSIATTDKSDQKNQHNMSLKTALSSASGGLDPPRHSTGHRPCSSLEHTGLCTSFCLVVIVLLGVFPLQKQP